MKPGWKTTEFWGITFASLLTAYFGITGKISATMAISAISGMQTAYMGMRKLEKEPEITTISKSTTISEVK